MYDQEGNLVYCYGRYDTELITNNEAELNAAYWAVRLALDFSWIDEFDSYHFIGDSEIVIKFLNRVY